MANVLTEVNSRLALIGLLFSMAIGESAAATSNSPRLAISTNGQNAVLQWSSTAGEQFQVEHRSNLIIPTPWQMLATNLRAGADGFTTFVHSNALLAQAGFYRLALSTNAAFTFNWNGTNFTYADSNRSFTGILLKPEGNGPFPAVIINHGAGGSVTNYSFRKAREMMPWGLACIAPNLTHVGGGETNPVNMGFCPENLERIRACLNVLQTVGYVDTNRVAIFGHSMGAFAGIGGAAVLNFRAAAITSSGVIPDSAGTTNAAPTVGEANPVRTPFLIIHCDGDPIVPAARSELFQQLLNSNAVPNQRILISSNSIPNRNNWHNIQNDANANTLLLTNTRAWFQTRGILP